MLTQNDEDVNRKHIFLWENNQKNKNIFLHIGQIEQYNVKNKMIFNRYAVLCT